MVQLTEKERKIYEFIVDEINKGKCSPSVRDIKDAIGFASTSTVHGYLRKLEEKGYIQREQGKCRTVRAGGSTTPAVPVLGKVAAGLPIFAEENYDGYISVQIPANYRSSEVFALRVKGESMIEAGILDGEYVVISKTPCAENGEIVVALIEEEATVKTFYKEKGHIRLQPENSTMRPIIVKDVTIVGKVIANIRFYK